MLFSSRETKVEQGGHRRRLDRGAKPGVGGTIEQNTRATIEVSSICKTKRFLCDGAP